MLGGGVVLFLAVVGVPACGLRVGARRPARGSRSFAADGRRAAGMSVGTGSSGGVGNL